MADYCVRAWKDGEPQDGGLKGGFGGVQYRSAYVAKMLLRMFELTGEQKYVDTATRLAEWIAPRQEADGWWRDTPHATRQYRNSPIFAGYTTMGLWPLWHRTGNTALLESLLKAVDYQVGMCRKRHPGTTPALFPTRIGIE